MLRRLMWAATATALMVSMAGCSAGKPVTTSATVPALRSYKNGEILSKQLLVSDNASARVYEIYYWSRGHRVEALFSEPIAPGKYPLLVDLHGGYAWRLAVTHDPLGFTATRAAQLASSAYDILYPQYQGYMGSDGTVRGLHRDVENTLDAIRAALSLGEVNPRQLYLLGWSLGGGVALSVAGDLPQQVRAVVAVSPYVGLRIVLPWEQQYAASGVFSPKMLALEGRYGDSPSPGTLAAQSPDISKIEAPVLLLQGTIDHHVPWQTVQEFYRQMKASGKSAQLILFPGGHHGLHNANGQASSSDIMTFFARYGLPFSF